MSKVNIGLIGIILIIIIILGSSLHLNSKYSIMIFVTFCRYKWNIFSSIHCWILSCWLSLQPAVPGETMRPTRTHFIYNSSEAGCRAARKRKHLHTCFTYSVWRSGTAEFAERYQGPGAEAGRPFENDPERSVVLVFWRSAYANEPNALWFEDSRDIRCSTVKCIFIE